MPKKLSARVHRDKEVIKDGLEIYNDSLEDEAPAVSPAKFKKEIKKELLRERANNNASTQHKSIDVYQLLKQHGITADFSLRRMLKDPIKTQDVTNNVSLKK